LIVEHVERAEPSAAGVAPRAVAGVVAVRVEPELGAGVPPVIPGDLDRERQRLTGELT